ncbi:MAG: glutamate--tRNA ligase [Acetobacter sp.]|nr:glutamate--tRNA ligase [Bacteroides sp.]MCM1340887.1 glutamate--tRNA ligase [Acetobacter sp.]MCM1432556.1 glutamate--tRNA ligase [Clostridiales bacterium]
MTEYSKLAELLFPNINKKPEYYENLFPPRNLKDGARVTRFAPSPTGFLHFGNLFTCVSAYTTAKATGGVFYVRVEDTDQKRKVDGAIGSMLKSLSVYGVEADEGVVGENEELGAYGPYYQSKRKDIYQCYGKYLVEQGLAYPCFCSSEEIEDIRNQQENEDIKGYYGKYAKCRNLSFDKIEENIKEGKPWTLRLKSPGDNTKKCWFDDLIKGKIEMPENVIDVVLLKTDGIPTYHFAHAIDDHLMRTTHVFRGDEWIASVPLHLQLFKVLGFKPVKYCHVAPIMKEENGGKRKLSKRKDPEAAVTFYAEQGYPRDSVNEYIMTIANSNFEDWRRANKDATIDKFPFNPKKMSVSGALFDIVKLTDVSKNVISQMTAEEVFSQSYEWAEEFNEKLAKLYEQDKAYATAVLNIDRGNKKPRKDIAKWSDIPDYISYMYDESFVPCYELSGNATAELAVEVLEKYKDIVDVNDDKDTWFDKIKSICDPVGCTPNVKEFKQNPDAFKGHVGDVSTIIRVALTGRTNTPDLHSITALLGSDRVNMRIESAISFYKEEK